MIDEKIASELEVILSEYQLLDIRLANVITHFRQQQSDRIEKKPETKIQGGKENAE